MAYAQDTAAVLGSPVTFKFEGNDVTFRPLDWDAMGTLMSRFVMKRLEAIPKMSEAGELIAVAVKSDNTAMVKAALSQAMETHARLLATASDPSFDEMLRWVMGDPAGIVLALSVCCDIDSNTILRMVMDMDRRPDGAVAVGLRRWMQVSGVIDSDVAGGEGGAKN